MAQESAKMEPRWPSWSQDGANMAPRCQRCVNMGRHCAYLEKSSFSYRFSWFLKPKGSLRSPKREPRSGQDGQAGAKMALRWPKRPPRWPSWSQEGANMAPRWPKMRQDGAKRAARRSQDGQVGAKMEPTWLQDAKDASIWADI